MEVSVNRLRAISDALFAHLERNGIKSVTITDDFYWDVPEDSRYSHYQEPTRHMVGQLSDDMNELNRMAEGTSPTVAYGFVWLAAVLRRLGEIGEAASR
jgi:hypothetical protein